MEDGLNHYEKPGRYSPKYLIMILSLLLLGGSYYVNEQRKENPEHWIELDLSLFRANRTDSRIGSGERPLDPHYLPTIIMGISGTLFFCSLFLQGYHKPQSVRFDGLSLVVEEGQALRRFPHDVTTIRITMRRNERTFQDEATEFATGVAPRREFVIVTLKNRESGDYLKLNIHDFSSALELGIDLLKFAEHCESST